MRHLVVGGPPAVHAVELVDGLLSSRGRPGVGRRGCGPPFPDPRAAHHAARPTSVTAPRDTQSAAVQASAPTARPISTTRLTSGLNISLLFT
jgi:hypothetical protein